MESLDLQPIPADAEPPLAYDQLVAERLIYPTVGKPAYAATPVGLACDPHIRAVFERNFGPERQERVERYVGDTAPEPVVELLYNTLSHVDHRRGVHNAGSYELRRREKVPPHLLGLAHYAHRGGATPAGSLRYADEMGMPSIELTKVTLSGTAWQSARMVAAQGMAKFSGTPSEWLANGTIDKGPEMGIAAYGKQGEILAVTVRARKDRGTTGGRWQVREMQSYIVRVDEGSGTNPLVTESMQLLAEPERSLAAMQERVRDINAANAAGDMRTLRQITREIVGNGSKDSMLQVANAAVVVRDFVQMVHGEIARDTLELRDWVIPVTQTIYAHDRWAQEPDDTPNPDKITDKIIRERLLRMVAEADVRHKEAHSQDWQKHVSYLTGVVALAQAS